jgi:integrase
MAQGSISKYEGPRGVRWRVRVDLGYGAETGQRRRVMETFATRREAQTWLTQQLNDVQQGVAVTPSKQTIGEMLAYWLDTYARHKVRASSFQDYAWLIQKHIVPTLGSMPVQQLTAKRLQQFYSDKQAGGASPRIIQLCHQRISQALNQAVSLGMLGRNVALSVTPPRVEIKEQATWNQEQVRRFLAVAHQSAYGAVWLITLATGMRRGEALGLRWCDADLERGSLRVVQAVGMISGTPCIHEPKTRHARRTVPIPPAVVARLREHRARQDDQRRTAGPAWREHGLIFPTKVGTPINPNNLTRDYDRLVVLAGVPRIRIHDQRHTYATLALERGASLLGVSKQLGHARPSTTGDLYAHVTAAMQQQVTDTMDDVLFGKMEEVRDRREDHAASSSPLG